MTLILSAEPEPSSPLSPISSTQTLEVPERIDGKELRSNASTTNLLPSAASYTDLVIKSHQLGVWRLFVAWEKPKGWDMKKRLEEYGNLRRGCLPTVMRVMKDTYRIAPRLSIASIFATFVGGFRQAVTMTLSTRLFQQVGGSSTPINAECRG